MKSYAIHNHVKGKKVFEEKPSVHIWANSPEEAERHGQLIIKNHPIYNQHFSDNVRAIEQQPQAEEEGVH